MASKAVAAAPEAISEESAKTQLADRSTEAQAVVDTTHADGTTVGNAPSVAGESQQDAEHISLASKDKRGPQAERAVPDEPTSEEPKTAKQPQPLNSNASQKQFLAPDTAISVTSLCAASTETTTESQSPAATSPTSEVLQRSEMSPEHMQYLTALGMGDDELGKVIKEPTERINKRVGNAVAHETKAKEHRRIAQKDFNDNIAYYYETKKRLLNPKYRPDLNTGMERTEEDNQKNFGAKDWQQFNAQCMAYSLQHANEKLKQFAKSEGLLTDGGGNIDDPEPTGEEQKKPEPRRTEDPTAQKRYEHIATAAMSIANANPADEVSKQILAAAEYVPAPLIPILPDLFTEVLSFLTNITKLASSIADVEVKAEAKRLLGKLLIHRPKPDPAKVLDAAQQEEQRKRDKRLASKNGGALGSASYNPPTNGTAEPVQTDRPSAESGEIAEPQGPSDASEPEQVSAAKDTTKRFHWVERTIGGQTQLIILDGDKVYDCYPSDALQEVKARIDKLNMPTVVEIPINEKTLRENESQRFEPSKKSSEGL